MKINISSSTGNPTHRNPNPIGARPSTNANTHGAKPGSPPTIRTTGREYVNPVDYQHPYESMDCFADFVALRYDANRTRHAYHHHLRLIHQHLACDPVTITEAQLRDYFLFVKLQKHWKPKTIRQAVAAARMFFIDLFGHSDWSVFSQIRTQEALRLPNKFGGRGVWTFSDWTSSPTSSSRGEEHKEARMFTLDKLKASDGALANAARPEHPRGGL